MLILSRNINQTIFIGEDIAVKVPRTCSSTVARLELVILQKFVD